MGDRLKGKVAIVTGAGSMGPGFGNGKAAAVLYAREGARLVLVDRDAAVEETKRLVYEEGGESIIVRADVSQSSDCKSIIEKCVQTFGRVDILHNNVGIEIPGGVDGISEEDWDRMMDVNLKSMFLTCKYALPHMAKQGSGSIINISSINAIMNLGYPSAAYSASKAGVIALTREIAIQYGPKGIRANTILPGFMDTPLVASALTGVYGGNTERMKRERDAMCPLGKQGDAWDTAYLALFLASDEAKYITGAAINVDGGLSCAVKLS